MHERCMTNLEFFQNLLCTLDLLAFESHKGEFILKYKTISHHYFLYTNAVAGSRSIVLPFSDAKETSRRDRELRKFHRTMNYTHIIHVHQ